jgi:hypothetical protein
MDPPGRPLTIPGSARITDPPDLCRRHGKIKGLQKTGSRRINLMFRAEAFNVINHPNYYGPLNAWDSANAQNFDTYSPVIHGSSNSH